MDRQPGSSYGGNSMGYNSSPSFKFSDREFEDGLGTPSNNRRSASAARSFRATLERSEYQPVYRSEHTVSKPIPIAGATERFRPQREWHGGLYFSGEEAPRTEKSIERLAEEEEYQMLAERNRRRRHAEQDARARREAEYQAVENAGYTNSMTNESSSSRGKSVAPRQDTPVGTPPQPEQSYRAPGHQQSIAQSYSSQYPGSTSAAPFDEGYQAGIKEGEKRHRQKVKERHPEWSSSGSSYSSSYPSHRG
ncbi:hypothetical protein F4678DRAFT_467513 [Xylaria arbuscula]|nr:hypothetical protein F4678DRAFT_467513 [Xylaria arbuscula]